MSSNKISVLNIQQDAIIKKDSFGGIQKLRKKAVVKMINVTLQGGYKISFSTCTACRKSDP